MKKRRGLKIFLVCVLVGFGLGWVLTRDRGRDDDDQGRKEIAVYADQQAHYNVADDDVREDVLDVDFADDVDPAYVESIGRRLGVAFRPASSYVDYDRLYRAAVDPDRIADYLAALRSDPRVEAAEAEVVYSIPDEELDATAAAPAPEDRAGFPNDPRFAEQWHMRQIHMPETWSAAQGQGVIVAVIDTGVSRVEDLAQTEFVPGWNFVDNTANADDDHGHGTHVAGTIAQSTHNGVGVTGVAYRAKIMPLKVLSAQGSGSVSGIAEAIRWAADHGAKVINMSLGGRMSSQILGKAVKYAHDKGVVVVCAAGNDGRGKVSYPAAYPGAVAVAATQKDEGTTFYSNWGKQIDIAAPGGNTRGDASGGVLQNTVFQGRQDYYFFMGTSMASPHVAGVAALVVGQGVTDPDAVERVLKDTARKPVGGRETQDYAEHYGAGIIDAQAAVRKAQLGVGGTELGAGLGLAALVLLALKRRSLLGHFGAAGLAGVVIGASGLFFLPQLGIGSAAGMSLLSSGLPGWDEALFGAAGHGNLLFYSAALPVALFLVLYGARRFRGLVAGLALGVGGHLLATAWMGTVDVHWMPLDGLWLVGNGLVATLVGYLAARR